MLKWQARLGEMSTACFSSNADSRMVCVHLLMYSCVCICVHVHVSVHVCVCMRMCVRVCMHVCVFVCEHICALGGNRKDDEIFREEGGRKKERVIDSM